MYCKHVRLHKRTEAHIHITFVYYLESKFCIYFKTATTNEKNPFIPKILSFSLSTALAIR